MAKVSHVEGGGKLRTAAVRAQVDAIKFRSTVEAFDLNGWAEVPRMAPVNSVAARRRNLLKGGDGLPYLLSAESSGGKLAKGDDPLQTLSSAIDLSTWNPDQDFEYHPIGSKPKRNYICPTPNPHPLLIPGHTYLFKVAQGWRAGQMWAEALASQIGVAAGLNVPRCFIAHDDRTGETGALIEFFVGYPGEASPERLIHGADLLQGRGFTVGADRPHNIFTNVEVCAELGVASEWWANLVVFDTFIGNTDRHTENWGVLADPENRHRMAPIFDNGTSLGYQQSDPQLKNISEAALDKFISQGTHHMSFDLANETRTKHMDLILGVAKRLPDVVAATDSMIHTTGRAVEAAAEACAALKVQPAFTADRAEFVQRLLRRRGELMANLVKGTE